ncbi:MAG TPA: TetR family transcriptional regulator [Candidatus Limnocylindrales bacterium]|nr:TetR family transcriptional regulator [Candidatus Limnocylindrales bacterium]
MTRTGRRPGEPATQERIASVARALFAERGFDATSVRAIATEAGVDPSLVLHYYGSKQALFTAVMKLPIDQWAVAGGLIDGGATTIGERLTRFALGIWDDPELRPSLLGVLRSAVTDPGAAQVLRDLFSRQGPVMVIEHFAPSEPELRSQLVASHLVGLAMARHILGTEPLASTDAEMIVAIVAPTIQHYITGNLRPERDDRPGVDR